MKTIPERDENLKFCSAKASAGRLRALGAGWPTGRWMRAQRLAEHLIRLRGGWECRGSGAASPGPVRLTLPIVWTEGGPPRLRLWRRFGRPPVDPVCQSLLLRMERVPGLERLELNGRTIGPASPERSAYEIELGQLPERNLLVLELERPRPGASGASGPEWGVIALIIASADPAALESAPPQ